MRLYLSADAAVLMSLRDGGSVTLPAFAAASDDEEDEFAALAEAAESGTVVVAADVDEVDDGDDQTVALDQVAALHIDVDGSGDLAWFATQEIDDVLERLPRQPR
jgi:glycosyltransferase involved in cell wall biosynthesis